MHPFSLSLSLLSSFISLFSFPHECDTSLFIETSLAAGYTHCLPSFSLYIHILLYTSLSLSLSLCIYIQARAPYSLYICQPYKLCSFLYSVNPRDYGTASRKQGARDLLTKKCRKMTSGGGGKEIHNTKQRPKCAQWQAIYIYMLQRLQHKKDTLDFLFQRF